MSATTLVSGAHEPGVRITCQLACTIPLFDAGCCRARGCGGNDTRAAGGGLCARGAGRDVRPPPGQQFAQASGLRVGVRGGSGLICLKDFPLLLYLLIFVWLRFFREPMQHSYAHANHYHSTILSVLQPLLDHLASQDSM